MKNIRIYQAYARIFFTHARSVGLVQNIIEDFGILNDLCASNQKLARVFNAPIASRAEKKQLLKTITTKEKLHSLSIGFLEIMIKNQVMSYLREIYHGFVDLSIAESGKISARLISAYDMSDKDLHKCHEKLEKHLDKRFVIKHEVDPSIIGGVILKFNSMMYDASILGAMRKLRSLV